MASRKPYLGIHTLCQWAAAQAKSYARGEWGTYRQWLEHGTQVRAGEKATSVVLWKFANNATEIEGGDERSIGVGPSRLLFTKGYSLFNVAQVEGDISKGAAWR